MINFFDRIITFLLQRKHSIFIFLKENGFFEEIIRGIVKLIFFVLVLYFFQQAVW